MLDIPYTSPWAGNNWGELQHVLPNPYGLVAVSKGMQAVKLCSNIILSS